MNLVSWISQLTSDSISSSSRKSDNTHTLIYRGCVYEVPKQQCHNPNFVQKQITYLLGKKLIYRGTTYQILPAEKPAMAAPKKVHRLIYRGFTYEKAI